VGEYASGNDLTSRTLIEHWNGTRWQVIPSPNIAGSNSNVLLGVAAVSANNLWTVGYDQKGNGAFQTLIEHWNGMRWQIVPSPNVGSSASLQSVAAISASNLWAVGYDQRGIDNQRLALIEHWNGTRWQVVPSPNAGSVDNVLLGVAAVSASNIWTVGYDQRGNGAVQTLIEHWNGTSWQVIPSPNAGSVDNILPGMAAISASNLWAVGSYDNSDDGPIQTLIEHWSGTS
jgi:hypothetical protein